MSGNDAVEKETLLDIAERNFKAGVNNWRTFANDDAMLNIVGYHFQQTVELALKHVLETHAVKYPRTHDIGDLLELIPPQYPNIFGDIEKYANKITALEAKTRYIKGYRTKVELIQVIYEITEKLLQDIEDVERKEGFLVEEESENYSAK